MIMWLKLPVIWGKHWRRPLLIFFHGRHYSHVTAAEIAPCHALPVTFLSAGHNRPITVVCDYRMRISKITL